MIKVLLVDDDPVVLRLYQRGLAQRGLQVDTATDGLGAVKALRQSRPDVAVLDLMMPNFSGVEVLKFIRADAALKDLPVIVLSNAYMNDLARDAAVVGAQKALLKVSCSPGLLHDCILEVVEGASLEVEPSRLVAAPALIPKPESVTPAPPAADQAPVPAPLAAPADKEGDEFRTQAREDFMIHARATSAALRQLFDAFTQFQSDHDRANRLEALFRKVHYLTAMAGLADCHLLAQMASVFEAMLYQVMDKPTHITPSVLHTAGMAVEFLERLLRQAPGPQASPLTAAQVLVVDDDSLSNRLVVTALRQVQLQARSTQDPLIGLQWLQEKRYDLVLLDIALPKIDGFEFYRRLRTLPGYQETPVIYVTAYTDFEARAKALVAGGDDVIAKPVLPTELAVKVVMHLMKKIPGQA